MADETNQRPYRGNEAPVRSPSSAATPSGNDPLAELARLIGQNDPFSEFGRDGARRTAAPRQPDPAPDWPVQHEPARQAPAELPLQAAAPRFGAPDLGRQPFGGAPLAAGNDLYEAQAPGYEAPGYQVPGYQVPGYEGQGYAAEPAAGGYEHEPFPGGHAQLGPEQDDYYDDAPANRRRIGILAIAGVFALAVIGTAGAFGYRALFGSSSSTSPPPVIKAGSAPSKIVPASAGKDARSSKMITDRVNERGQGEKLVSREETPVAVGQKPANIVFPQNQNAGAPQLGSGVVGAEPKKIRTIAIHPDQSGTALPEPTAEAQSQAPVQPRVTNITPARQPTPAPAPPRVVSTQRVAPEPEPVRQAAPPVRQAAAPSANAPLSLNPNAPAPARAAPAAPRAAAVAPPTQLAATAATGAAGGYAVQVSSQRSEADAQAAFRSLQGKFPEQLGSRQPLIKRVDLGAKGIYFRAMVGPFGSSGEAGQLCSSLKSAGGQCIVQKN